LTSRPPTTNPVVESSGAGELPNRTASIFATLGTWDQALALSLFPGRFPRSADRLCFLARPTLRRLFISLATFHLAKNALALHLLLQDPESLIDVVIANEYLQMFSNRAAAVLVGGRDFGR
jgi:hypothetical protein